jgi:hypothetical protein
MEPITARPEWFPGVIEKPYTSVTASFPPDLRREVEVLSEEHGTSRSSVVVGLVRAGLRAYSEAVDRYARAQDDLAARLERLGYDDEEINRFFETHEDLSKLDEVVGTMEAKKR